MVLPFSRNETPAVGTQVKSATNIDLQDSVIQAAHGSLAVPVSCLAGPAIAGAFDSSAAYWASSSGVQVHYIPLPLIVGDRIQSIESTLYRDGGSVMKVELFRLLNSGTLEWAGGGWQDTSVNPPLATVDQNVMAGGADYTIGADELMFFKFTTAQTGDRIYKIEIRMDRPLL